MLSVYTVWIGTDVRDEFEPEPVLRWYYVVDPGECVPLEPGEIVRPILQFQADSAREDMVNALSDLALSALFFQSWEIAFLGGISRSKRALLCERDGQ